MNTMIQPGTKVALGRGPLKGQLLGEVVDYVEGFFYWVQTPDGKLQQREVDRLVPFEG